jgi:hypothetical protein
MPHGSGYRPVPNQNYQAMQPQHDAARLSSASRGRKSRPVSWHPASARNVGYSTPYIPMSAAEYPSTMGLGSQPLNTIPSYADGSMFSDPPLDLDVSNDSFAPFSGVQDPQLQQPPLMQMDNGFDVDLNMPSIPPMPDNWPFDMMSMNNSMPSADPAASTYESVPSSAGFSAPSTPDLLPIQRPEPDSVADNQEPEDELVGMGLYNSPPALETSRQGVSGKGLKLEETFTPSSDTEQDKRADDADQGPPGNNDFVSNDSQPVATPFKQPAKPPVDLLRKSFLFDDDLDLHGLPDTQRLVNWADQPCMNYGYGWI